MLDNTLEDFKQFEKHIYKTKAQPQALHFAASLFKKLPADSCWRIEDRPKQEEIV